MVAGTGRGLTLEGIKHMELGAFIDFCIEWNEMNDPEPEKKKETKRGAEQADWNALLG